jgi:hypothetical protein
VTVIDDESTDVRRHARTTVDEKGGSYDATEKGTRKHRRGEVGDWREESCCYFQNKEILEKLCICVPYYERSASLFSH